MRRNLYLRQNKTTVGSVISVNYYAYFQRSHLVEPSRNCHPETVACHRNQIQNCKKIRLKHSSQNKLNLRKWKNFRKWNLSTGRRRGRWGGRRRILATSEQHFDVIDCNITKRRTTWCRCEKKSFWVVGKCWKPSGLPFISLRWKKTCYRLVSKKEEKWKSG